MEPHETAPNRAAQIEPRACVEQHKDGWRISTEATFVTVDHGAGGNASDAYRIFVPTVRVTGHFLIRTQGPAEPIIPVIQSVANSDAPELSLVVTRTIAAIENGQRTAS